MNSPALVIAAACFAGTCFSTACQADDAKTASTQALPAASAPPAAVPAPPVLANLDRPESDAQTKGEPNVKRTVIEDGGSRVEELRVRGQTQRITVTPKVGGMKPYEILNGDSSRDLSEAPDSTRGASGKRVWHVLSF